MVVWSGLALLSIIGGIGTIVVSGITNENAAMAGSYTHDVGKRTGGVSVHELKEASSIITPVVNDMEETETSEGSMIHEKEALEPITSLNSTALKRRTSNARGIGIAKTLIGTTATAFAVGWAGNRIYQGKLIVESERW